MAPLHVGALVALALAAPGGEPDRLAMNFPPPAAVSDLVEEALPRPPDRVYLETRTFGTVTVDHKAHLARRVACRACHGQGPVSSIAFTPRSAHESCRACHVSQNRGPTNCRDCHVQQAEPPVGAPGENVRFVYRGPRGERLSGPTSSLTQKAVAKAAAKPPPPPPPPSIPPPPPPPSAEVLADADETYLPVFRRSADLAVSMAPGAETTIGPAVRLSIRTERVALVQSIDWTSGPGLGRMGGQLGIGPIFPLRRRLDLQLLGIAGLDWRYKPIVSMKAAVGASAELQWYRSAFPRMLGVNLTALTDLGEHTDAYGERVGAVTVSLGFVAGFALPQ